MRTLGYLMDIRKSGEVVTVNKDTHTYAYVGSAYIIDKDGDRISPDDILEKGEILAARGNGKVIITYGHTDTPVGLGSLPQKIMLKDPDTGDMVKGVYIEVEYPDFGPTSHEVWKAHEEGRVNGLSIRGKLWPGVGATMVCDDDACETQHREITKGEWFSFALCTDEVKPRNRLATMLGKEGRTRVLENIRKGTCPVCDDYEHMGLTHKEAEVLVKGLLMDEPHTEEIHMDEELKKSFSSLMEEVKGMRDDLTKSAKPEEPKDEPENISKADIMEMIGSAVEKAIGDLKAELAKAGSEKEPEPEPEPEKEPEPGDEPDVKKGDVEEPKVEDGETDPVPNGDENITKGALDKNNKPKITKDDILKSMGL